MLLTRDHAAKVLEIVDHGLSNGLGVAEPGKLCVEAAVCLALGLPHGDNPPCVGPAVRSYKISLNDSCGLPPLERAALLRRLAVAQLGSDTIDQTKFSRLLAEKATRRIVPIALRAAASVHPEAKHRDALEAAAIRCESEGTADAAAADAAAADAAAARWAADAAAADRKRIFEIAAQIGVEALQECGSPGCEWLDLCEVAT